MEILWNRIAASEWQRLEADTALPMQQHPAYGATVALLGAQVRRAEILVSGERVGLAQIITRRFGPVSMSLLSRGPIWLRPLDNAVRCMGLRRLARGCGCLISTPQMPVSGKGLVPLSAARQLAAIDLRPDTDALRAALAGKWRNRLVRAGALGLEICARVPLARDLDWLLHTELAQQKTLRYRALPVAFTLAWHKANPAAMRLYEAKAGGRRVAAMLMLLHRPWASYHIGWSGAEGRRLNAHNSLMWQAIRDLKDHGFSGLDLGQVDWRSSPGLARFKAGTGAAIAPSGATVLVLPRLIRQRS